MKKMLRGAVLFAAALAFVHVPSGRAEAAPLGALRFAKMLRAQPITSSAITASALTPRQEFRLKARIVFQQYRALVLASRIERLQQLRSLFVQFRQGLIDRQQFVLGRTSVISAFVTNATVLRARLARSLTAIRNDPAGAPATLVR